jgi:phospholipid/cholesterol/gamma-HCH transport system substrate-binding protein
VRRYTEAQLLRLGAITVVVMLVVMAAAFNLSKFPGFGGDTYQAYFADASGLHKGNMVQVGGIRAGRVQDLKLDKGKVLVTFEVDHGVEFGKDSQARVEVLNLLGEKYLNLIQSVASRDAEIQHLLQSSRDVSSLLADRSTDLVDLMKNSSLVFEEVRHRKQAIHRLLVNARILATQLRGVATDNQAQLKPALQEVDDLLDLLISKDKELKATLAAVGPYASILGNSIGTGPWFDAYASNLAAIPTGEFQPGPPDS